MIAGYMVVEYDELRQLWKPIENRGNHWYNWCYTPIGAKYILKYVVDNYPNIKFLIAEVRVDSNLPVKEGPSSVGIIVTPIERE